MKFDSRSADAFGQVDIVVNNAGIPDVAPLAPWQKDRPAPGRAAAMLAFAAGLLVAALGARAADQPARPQSRDPARSAFVRSRLRSSSRRPISPTSAPATRATSTSSIASSSVRRQRPRRVPARAPRLRAAPSDNADREG
jgi:NAD(P)-dependent dehydrogenase (short-subunit alcohol dehydrogenase family)